MEEKLKILLCEDDENLGMLLREYLQAKGYIATLCPDSEEGDKTSQRRNAYHLPHCQGVERRYTRRFQDWSRRLYY